MRRIASSAALHVTSIRSTQPVPQQVPVPSVAGPIAPEQALSSAWRAPGSVPITDGLYNRKFSAICRKVSVTLTQVRVISSYRWRIARINGVIDIMPRYRTSPAATDAP